MAILETESMVAPQHADAIPAEGLPPVQIFLTKARQPLGRQSVLPMVTGPRQTRRLAASLTA
jgi:hypothetical protein